MSVHHIGTPPPTPQAPCSDIDTLQTTIIDMDALSQQGFSQIECIAKLALNALETPFGYEHQEYIALALKTISGHAQDLQNCINGQAELVGCNYSDAARARRFAAVLAANEAREKP